MNSNKYTNSLITESSPYLLQHAHNPVNWHAWSDKIVADAKKENKLLLVSIGYSACHWCHVMEHECFENEDVASVMNANFICIKVDREERPDVDHYYMTAVQLMHQQGGWPLNVITLPDGRPIWGGTYFPKESWVKNIQAVADFFKQNPEKIIQYAESLQNGINQVSLTVEVDNAIPANKKLMENAVTIWKTKFDMKLGGRIGQPKFPMPVTLDFLLYYGYMRSDSTVLEYVKTTLTQMGYGGIYDQAGGGFARYSVDEKWKVPHFEKMLYDNGQLLSVYAKGFQLFKNPEYKKIVYETVDFIQRELMDKSGAFYSSLDADSDGEEGKYYVWKKEELQKIIGDDFDLFTEYYNVNSNEFWENGNYILFKKIDDISFSKGNNISLTQLNNLVLGWKTKLLGEREKRVRPSLDDKTLTSWNALVIQGLTDAYKTFNEPEFLELAENNALFIVNNQMQESGKLFRTWKKGKSTVDGFMEDYALTIRAFISLFEITGDSKWIGYSRLLINYSFEHFFDAEKGLFYFSENNTTNPVTNHFQTEDNVIPAANSVMANNLFSLYLLEGKPEYLTNSKKMLSYDTPQFTNYPMAYSNWGNLMVKLTEPFYEVAVVGGKAKSLVKELQSGYIPNFLWAFSSSESKIPLLENRFVKGKTLIYICREGVCQLPVETTKEALELISPNKN